MATDKNPKPVKDTKDTNVVNIATKSTALKDQLEAEQLAERETFSKELTTLMERYHCAIVPVFTILEKQVAVAAVVNFPMTLQIVTQA